MSLMLIISLLCGLAAVAALIWASASIRSQLYLHSLCRGEGGGSVVALTFDDGPDLVRTPEVLEVLARHGVKATFFLIGSKAEGHPDLVRRIVAEGHIIGNHTYNHRGSFPLCGGTTVCEELARTRQTLERITGLRTRLFRPPFGVTNPIIGRAVRGAGYSSIGWSVRSLDTIARTPRKEVLDRILHRIHPGAIVLLHDRCEESAALLDALLTELKGRGYTTQTIEELLDLQAYEK